VAYSTLLRPLAGQWSGDGGYREMLAIALPLVLSTGSWSIQHFVDRMFLTWYSPEAIAASTPAGMLSFTIICLFSGTAGYVNTFVAQYYGAKRFDRIGGILWQGVYIAVIGGVLHFMLIPLARPIFVFVGHDPAVMSLEIVYFQILCLGAMPGIASQVMAGFFSGRSRTWPIMWVNLAATAINIVLDYILIFGNWGFPEMGVTGAAIATVAAYFSIFFIYLVLMAKRRYRGKYRTFADWRFDGVQFRRLMRYGIPNGVQLFLEIAGFTVFILLVGRKGIHFLAATNIALNINSVAFLPMIGFGLAISVLVGQYLGDNRPDTAERSTWSGFHLTFAYMTIVAALYVFAPDLFLAPYASHANDAEFTTIREITVILLRFVAFYSLFDALNIVFSYAVKGAGDTRFVMKVIILDSIFVMVIPSYIALSVFDAGIYWGWSFVTTFIVILGIIFYLRFRTGKWRTMRVIEHIPPALPQTLAEAPFQEIN